MNWRAAPIGPLCRVVGGGTPSKLRSEYWSGDIPWVSPKDMVTFELKDTEDHITEDAVAQSSTQIVPSGSVLVVVRSGILARYLPVALAATAVALNQDLKALIPKKNVLDSRFLAYFLRASSQSILKACVKHGATVHSLNTDALTGLEIPLPPFSEQRRIVEILDRADRLRRLRAEADAKADRILPALFIKMFGDPTTNPKGWRVRTLGELATLGPEYGANARAIPLSPGQPRYVRITDIDDDGRLRPLDAVGIDLDEWEQYKLEEGDLLFARSGATVGKTYLHRLENGPCVFAGYLIRFRLDPAEIHPLVAFGFTHTMSYRGWVGAKRRTAAQPNINGQEYSSLRLPVPARSVQEHFAWLCSSVEVLRHALLCSSRRLESLFSVLLRRAFSGDLTASWREAHMKELLQEMEQQAKVLAGTGSR